MRDLKKNSLLLVSRIGFYAAKRVHIKNNVRPFRLLTQVHKPTLVNYLFSRAHPIKRFRKNE